MPELSSLSRLLIAIGLGLALLGVVVGVLGRAGLPLGQLPGDLRFKLGNTTCFVPLASMLLLSLLITLAANLIIRLLNR